MKSGGQGWLWIKFKLLWASFVRERENDNLRKIFRITSFSQLLHWVEARARSVSGQSANEIEPFPSNGQCWKPRRKEKDRDTLGRRRGGSECSDETHFVHPISVNKFIFKVDLFQELKCQLTYSRYTSVGLDSTPELASSPARPNLPVQATRIALRELDR